MTKEMYGEYERLSQKYYVDNINVSDAKYIFILESPHIQEVKHKVPVAGPSGRMMTKFLFDNDLQEPLGMLLSQAVKGNPAHPKLLEIGLLNVCNVPMQGAAYTAEDREEYAEFISALEAIRVKYASKSYKIDEWNDARAMLLAMFDAQLEKLIDKECYIIPCGKFAETYYRMANARGKDWKVIEGVPHPSRNQWYYEFEGLKRLEKIF